MHGVAKQQTFLNTGILQCLTDLLGDVDECATAGDVEYEFLSVAFHVAAPCVVFIYEGKCNLQLKKVKSLFPEKAKSSFFLDC